jgi:hypothetical protein
MRYPGKGYTLKRVAFGFAENGDNTAIAAVSGKKLAIVELFLAQSKDATAAVGVLFKSGASTVLMGATGKVFPLDKTGVAGSTALGFPYSPNGHFETTSGEAFVVNLDGAQGVMGFVVYIEVEP